MLCVIINNNKLGKKTETFFKIIIIEKNKNKLKHKTWQGYTYNLLLFLFIFYTKIIIQFRVLEYSNVHSPLAQWAVTLSIKPTATLDNRAHKKEGKETIYRIKNIKVGKLEGNIKISAQKKCKN